MRVAIFTDNDFGKVNGVTTTLRAALAHVPPTMTLRIYTASDMNVDTPDYLALRSIGLPIPFYGEMRMYIPRLLAFVRRAKADRIDVVHLTTPGPVGLAALFVAWRLKLPLVGSFHTDLAAYTEVLSGSKRLGVLMREYMRWPYGKCSRVLVPSEHTRQLLIDAKANPNKLQVWVRGVDTATFTPARRSDALRAQWGVSLPIPAIVFVGRISAEKGLGIVAAVRDRLLRAGLAHRFVFVGSGPLAATLRRQMPDAVFTGTLSREGVADALASSDVFIFPSRTDTAGNVVLEAQACGLPVIVSGDGGARENVVAKETGLVCFRPDPDEWAAAIASLLKAPDRRFAMGAAARAYALSRTWSNALQPLYRAYRDAVPVTRAVEAHDHALAEGPTA